MSPISNTTYTPNQFFDVCLPYASRGCVRAVGFLLHKTLGWCDEDGNPIESQFRLPHGQFERHAGIGHSSVKSALDEAIQLGFLVCRGEPHASSAVAPNQPSLSFAGTAALITSSIWTFSPASTRARASAMT